MASLEQAIVLAARAHAGQRDKAGDPYILHPLRVMLAQSDEPAQICAVLHDVVEDTEITLDDLVQSGFSDLIVSSVDALSRRADEQYTEYLERLLANQLARQVKRADLEDNLSRSRQEPKRYAEQIEKYEAALARLDQYAAKK